MLGVLSMLLYILSSLSTCYIEMALPNLYMYSYLGQLPKQCQYCNMLRFFFLLVGEIKSCTISEFQNLIMTGEENKITNSVGPVNQVLQWCFITFESTCTKCKCQCTMTIMLCSTLCVQPRAKAIP